MAFSFSPNAALASVRMLPCPNVFDVERAVEQYFQTRNRTELSLRGEEFLHELETSLTHEPAGTFRMLELPVTSLSKEAAALLSNDADDAADLSLPVVQMVETVILGSATGRPAFLRGYYFHTCHTILAEPRGGIVLLSLPLDRPQPPGWKMRGHVRLNVGLNVGGPFLASGRWQYAYAEISLLAVPTSLAWKRLLLWAILKLDEGQRQNRWELYALRVFQEHMEHIADAATRALFERYTRRDNPTLLTAASFENLVTALRVAPGEFLAAKACWADYVRHGYTHIGYVIPDTLEVTFAVTADPTSPAERWRVAHLDQSIAEESATWNELRASCEALDPDNILRLVDSSRNALCLVSGNDKAWKKLARRAESICETVPGENP